MFDLSVIEEMNKKQRYNYMLLLLKGQLKEEKDTLANLSNATAFIRACVDDLNWAGFYFSREDELVLGPFQGLPACNRIALDKGVCGACITKREVQLVADVEKFPGHIACDAASKSELVIPIIKDEKVYGVLDLDSPKKGRFTEEERDIFIKFVHILNEYINWEEV